MRNKIGRDYQHAVSTARARGVDFTIDFHAQSVGDLMAELAKDYGYRKPKNANGSTGRYFFEMLHRRIGKTLN